MQIAKMNAMLTATASGFKKTFEGAGKDAETFAGKMKGIKAQLGEESGLGNFAKVLRGAGAVAGLGVLVAVLDNASKKAVELKNAFDAGKISAGGIAEELVKSLPILGQAFDLGRNIRELFTGEEAREQRIIDKMQEQTEKRQEQNKELLASRNIAIDLQERLALAYATPIAAKFMQLKFQADKDLREIRAATKLNPQRRASLIGTRMAVLDAESANLAMDLVNKQLKAVKDMFDFGGEGFKFSPNESGIFSSIGGFIKKGLEFAMNPWKQSVPQAPELLQAGSQAAASFINRAQREQRFGANDPAVVAQKATEKNTKRTADLTEQVVSNISRPVELI